MNSKMRKLETRKRRHIDRQMLRKQINQECMEEFLPEDVIGIKKELYYEDITHNENLGVKEI